MSRHHNGVVVKTSTMKPQHLWFKSDWGTLLRHTHMFCLPLIFNQYELKIQEKLTVIYHKLTHEHTKATLKENTEDNLKKMVENKSHRPRVSNQVHRDFWLVVRPNWKHPPERQPAWL